MRRGGLPRSADNRFPEEMAVANDWQTGSNGSLFILLPYQKFGFMYWKIFDSTSPAGT